jgi:hypothetical protein
MVDPPPDGGEHVTAEPAVDNKFQAFSYIVTSENNLISQRMTWLMTLNGFVIGAAALLASSSHAGDTALEIAFIAVTTLGAASNLSTFFSNYWAEIAMQSADIGLRKWVRSNGSSEDLDLLRLYGRDPSDQVGAQENPTFWSGKTPLTLILHPWFFLPALFWLAFLFGGAVASIKPMTVPSVLCLLPSIVISAGAGVLVLIERARRSRRQSGTRV